MNVEIHAEEMWDKEHKIIIKIESGVSDFSTFDIGSMDKIEDLELQLTKAVDVLRNYRKGLQE